MSSRINLPRLSLLFITTVIVAMSPIVMFTYASSSRPLVSQIFANTTAVTDNPSAALWLDNPTGSFNATGKISSIIMHKNAPISVVSGNWKLLTFNGNITEFSANFTEAFIGTEERHNYQLSSFKMNVKAPILLDKQGTTFSGESDIKEMESNMTWYGVQTTAVISKQDVLKISFDDESTARHFQSQPLYGIVYSIQPNQS